ncbi:MAG: carboxypeptidase-like regulatory domain-containing protein [Thermoplasmatales archaeon]|nr:carboxypeptidase-like regulatory domain-containing protein [Thermoplasmatales archaeon]
MIILSLFPVNTSGEGVKNDNLESSVVCGYITDSETGEPIANANISIYTVHMTSTIVDYHVEITNYTTKWYYTSTNTTGYYEINITPGSFHFRTNVPGYLNFADNFVVHENKTMWLNISIDRIFSDGNFTNKTKYNVFVSTYHPSTNVSCNFNYTIFNSTVTFPSPVSTIWLSPSIEGGILMGMNETTLCGSFNISLLLLNETELNTSSNINCFPLSNIFVGDNTNTSINIVFNSTTTNYTVYTIITDGVLVYNITPVYHYQILIDIINLTEMIAAINWTCPLPVNLTFNNTFVILENVSQVISVNVSEIVFSVELHYIINGIERNIAMEYVNGTTYKGAIGPSEPGNGFYWVIARDKNGNVTNIIPPMPLNVKDTTKPEILEYTHLTSINEDTTATVYVNVTDNYENVEDLTVMLYIDSQEVPMDYVSGNMFSAVIGPFEQGETEYYIGVIDSSGNYNCTEKICLVVKDVTLPSVAIVELDQTVNTSTFTMHWSTDAIDLKYYEVRINNGDWVNIGTNTSYIFVLSKGTNTLYVRGTDTADNTGTADSITVTYTKKEAPKGFIPGFEAIILIVMIGVCIMLLRRRNH